MTSLTSKALYGVACSFLFIFLFSCSKDTDLLADYIVSDNPSSAIANIVINDNYFVNGQNSLVLDVLSNDTFNDKENVEIIDVSIPDSGTILLNKDKTITYTPKTTIDTNSETNTEESEEIELDKEDSTKESSQNITEPTKDSFTYTTETTNEEGNKEVQTGTVNITIDYGELKAFPGAEGFGKHSLGGRGGKIIYVTNLNDSGNGSLREAIDTSGPRIVIFRVGGYITLNSALVIRDSNITIAGQSAPGDGITLRVSGNGDFPCMRSTADNVIIRGIRFRPGPGIDKSILGDGLVLTGGNNIIIDHCSFSWATDELTDPYGAKNVTYQNCIFSEALMYSSHIYSTDPTNSQYKSPHSMGMLIGDHSNKVTIFNSVFAHNNQRNPLIGGNTSVGGDFELVNNIYYNWGSFGTVILTGSNSRVNLMNSLHIPGMNTNKKRLPILVGKTAKVYAKNNISEFKTNNSQAEALTIGHFSSPFNNQLQSEDLSKEPFDFPLSTFPFSTRENIMDNLLSDAGAFAMDDVDKRIIQDVRNISGSMINDPSEVGGYPTLNNGDPYIDVDKDGMDDLWEIDNGLDPTNKLDGNLDRNNDGYSNIDDFLHELTL
ncbi:hypothetical protein D9O36_13770 [Zobellia amurskyensis]|uniref:pectate lyase n=1 Tax=Zobellia amurskyensis TaxID=248905 RepID=A0A7X2ZV23_9FLAO|nr:hypothetical protein [Zobellia amurskyensis]MUH36917.1 hypothetical protein [Zobellia amurskyensis]